MGVVGADGLRFLAFSETVLRFLEDDGFTVPFFLNGLQIFFDKDDSRSQVSTNLEIKLRIFVRYKKILMENLQLLTFST